MKSKGGVAGLVSERACEFLPSVLCCAHLVSNWNEQVFVNSQNVGRRFQPPFEKWRRCQIVLAPASLQIFSSHRTFQP